VLSLSLQVTAFVDAAAMVDPVLLSCCCCCCCVTWFPLLFFCVAVCSTFNIPFSRSASFDDNLAFFKEVLAELQR
jgi:hypothetical protein